MYHRDHLIEQTDPELWAAIVAENARQEHHIELIASENSSKSMALTQPMCRPIAAHRPTSRCF